MKSNIKTITAMLLLSVFIIVSVAATKPTSKKPVTITAHTNDTGYFKNLQVLPKDISKDSLDHIMHHFTASLGVRCNFCHAFNNGKPDFASDEKEEKGIARYMMRMTASIDSAYFNFEKSTRPDTITVVKCVTCHHGHAHPDEATLSNENNNMPPPGNPPPGQMPPPPSPGSDSTKAHKN